MFCGEAAVACRHIQRLRIGPNRITTDHDIKPQCFPGQTSADRLATLIYATVVSFERRTAVYRTHDQELRSPALCDGHDHAAVPLHPPLLHTLPAPAHGRPMVRSHFIPLLSDSTGPLHSLIACPLPYVMANLDQHSFDRIASFHQAGYGSRLLGYLLQGLQPPRERL